MGNETNDDREPDAEPRARKVSRWTAPIVLTLALPFAAQQGGHRPPIGSPAP